MKQQHKSQHEKKYKKIQKWQTKQITQTNIKTQNTKQKI